MFNPFAASSVCKVYAWKLADHQRTALLQKMLFQSAALIRTDRARFFSLFVCFSNRYNHKVMKVVHGSRARARTHTHTDTHTLEQKHTYKHTDTHEREMIENPRDRQEDVIISGDMRDTNKPRLVIFSRAQTPILTFCCK